MRTSFGKTMAIAALTSVGAFVANSASAQCNPLASILPQMQKQSWIDIDPPRMLFVDEKGDEDVVGFWNIVLTSHGNLGIPDGAILDKGFQQWHADGTEFLNSSGQKPLTQNYCLGTWAKIGKANYSLNHFAYNYDAAQNLTGITRIREVVTLGPNRNTFSGTFVIDAYDTARNPLVHLTGTVSGKRITQDTTAQEVV
jgi:hypothetical protein